MNVRLTRLEVRERHNQRPIRVSATRAHYTLVCPLVVVGVLVHVSAQRLKRNTLTLFQGRLGRVNVDFQPRPIHLRDTQRRPVRANRIRGHTQTGCSQLGSRIMSLFQRTPSTVSQHLNIRAAISNSDIRVRVIVNAHQTCARIRGDTLNSYANRRDRVTCPIRKPRRTRVNRRRTNLKRTRRDDRSRECGRSSARCRNGGRNSR